MMIISFFNNFFNFNKKCSDENKINKLCKCCIYYEKKQKSCKLFAKMNENNGNIEYLPANVARFNDDYCGFNGKYYTDFSSTK